MIKKNIFKNKCGAILKILSCPSNNKGNKECEELEKLKENNFDASLEKHVPIIKNIDSGYEVIVGEIDHPMLEDHYIEWIELNEDDICHIKFLKPGSFPKAVFKTNSKNIWARAYCNLHGLWKSK